MTSSSKRRDAIPVRPSPFSVSLFSYEARFTVVSHIYTNNPDILPSKGMLYFIKHFSSFPSNGEPTESCCHLAVMVLDSKAYRVYEALGKRDDTNHGFKGGSAYCRRF